YKYRYSILINIDTALGRYLKYRYQPFDTVPIQNIDTLSTIPIPTPLVLRWIEWTTTISWLSLFRSYSRSSKGHGLNRSAFAVRLSEEGFIFFITKNRNSKMKIAIETLAYVTACSSHDEQWVIMSADRGWGRTASFDELSILLYGAKRNVNTQGWVRTTKLQNRWCPQKQPKYGQIVPHFHVSKYGSYPRTAG
ncbi:unnamed protein product, partial [Nesidiocoris tenuis]